MKRLMMVASFTFFLIWEQFAFAKTSQLFNVNIALPGLTNNPGIGLNISTNIPNHTYQFAGIKINTPGYAIRNPGVECTPSGNGYCLFSVSDTVPALIFVNFPLNPQLFNALFPIPNIVVDMTLCLNGMGSTFSCENHTLRLNPQA